jgi:hypothetical protein
MTSIQTAPLTINNRVRFCKTREPRALSLSVRLILSCSLLFAFLSTTLSVNAFADSIVLLGKSNTEEEYFGRLVGADTSSIKFDIECKGNIQEFPWGKKIKGLALFELHLNGKCMPEVNLGIGGQNLDCVDRFLVSDSVYNVVDCYRLLSFDRNLLSFVDRQGSRVSYDLTNRSVIDSAGRRKVAKKLAIDISVNMDSLR